MTRSNCTICGGDLAHVYTYNNFPVYMGAAHDKEVLFEDQVWASCQNCGCVQLTNLIDPDILYKHPHNPAIGKTWQAHNIAYAAFINSLIQPTDKILEIGGGNCRLANEILKNSKPGGYVIYDKHSYDEPHPSISFKDNFFDPKSYVNNENSNVIISSHFVEHMYNPHEFIECFHKTLPSNGLVIFSFPHITNILKDKITNGLNFEHTYQLDPFYLTKLMTSYGFSLETITDFSRYNPFMAFRKTSNKRPTNPFEQEDSNTLFTEFLNYHKENAHDLMKRVIPYKNRFLFGCHVFSQYLLYFGLEEKCFHGIIDNDSNKIGKKLYGSNLLTYGSNIVKDLSDVAVIVQAGQYTQEITETLLSYNKNCIIIS